MHEKQRDYKCETDDDGFDMEDFQDNKKHILKKINSKVTANHKKNQVTKKEDFKTKKFGERMKTLSKVEDIPMN